MMLGGDAKTGYEMSATDLLHSGGSAFRPYLLFNV
jgi:hypothetical protein